MTAAYISYGGGVQSTAMVVLACQHKLGYPIQDALFANVGDDSEHPATNTYVRDVMTPWAAEHNVTIHELHKINGTRSKHPGPETLWQQMMREGSKSLEIPFYLSATSGPSSRSCTVDFKVDVVSKFVRDQGHGTTLPPADMLIGISVDEIERAGRGKELPWQTRRYPLLDLGLNRSDCQQLIARAGLPVPPKSACFFCPFHSRQAWAEQRRDDPELFDKAQLLEDTMTQRRIERGQTPVYLTSGGKRLSDAVTEAQTPLFDTDTIGSGNGCDSGYCWT